MRNPDPEYVLDLLVEFYKILNNRILGAGGNPNTNWELNEQCRDLCKLAAPVVWSRGRPSDGKGKTDAG